MLWQARQGLIAGRGALDAAAGGGADAAQTTAFLARVASNGTTLDATHINAYKALINGLVSDGVFAKLDVLYIVATQDKPTAKLNLVGNTFPISDPGTGYTWTADRGFVAASGVWSSGFVPATAGGLYAQISAHIMLWNNPATNGDGNCQLAIDDATHIYARFADTNFYGRIQLNGAAGSPVANGHGFYIVNRSALGAWQSYKDGSSVTSGSGSASALSTLPMTIPADTGSAQSSSTDQVSAFGAGGSLNSTDVSNYYTRMRTYMTAVGVP